MMARSVARPFIVICTPLLLVSMAIVQTMAVEAGQASIQSFLKNEEHAICPTAAPTPRPPAKPAPAPKPKVPAAPTAKPPNANIMVVAPWQNSTLSMPPLTNDASWMLISFISCFRKFWFLCVLFSRPRPRSRPVVIMPNRSAAEDRLTHRVSVVLSSRLIRDRLIVHGWSRLSMKNIQVTPHMAKTLIDILHQRSIRQAPVAVP